MIRSGLSTKTLERGTKKVFNGIIESTGEKNTREVVLDQNYFQLIAREMDHYLWKMAPGIGCGTCLFPTVSQIRR